MKITNYGEDPTWIISMISRFPGEDFQAQTITTLGKSLGTISGCKAVEHLSLDKMHLGKS